MSALYTTSQLNQVLPSVSGRHQNWAKYGLAVPEVSYRRPSRRGNRHSIQDLVALGVLHQLFENGMSGADIRSALSSEETFKATGFDYQGGSPGRRLSRFLRAHGFDWTVVVVKSIDGSAELCICEGTVFDHRGIASQSGSVTLIHVGRIHDEIVRRLTRIGDASLRDEQADTNDLHGPSTE